MLAVPQNRLLATGFLMTLQYICKVSVSLQLSVLLQEQIPSGKFSPGHLITIKNMMQMI